MASSIIALMDIEDATNGFLRRYSRQDIRDAKSGAPGFAYEEPLLWISPIPTVATVIVAYGIFRPTPLSGDGDDPSVASYGGLAPEFHPAVLDYALWHAAEYVQHQESARARSGIAYEGQDGFGGDIAKMKRILAKRVTRRRLAGGTSPATSGRSPLGRVPEG
jgi:hypothetical protein